MGRTLGTGKYPKSISFTVTSEMYQEYEGWEGNKAKKLRKKLFGNGVRANKDIEQITILNTMKREQIGMIMKLTDDFRKYRKITIALLEGKNIGDDDYAYLTRDY